MEKQAIRIPLREAGGTYASTARYSGDCGGRIGRHANQSKTNAARALRKRQRREWKKVEE